MIKKLSVIFILLCVVCISGCNSKVTEIIKIPQKNYEKTTVEEEKIDLNAQPDNVRRHDSGESQDLDIKEYVTNKQDENFIAKDKKITINIDGKTENLNYEQLAERINSTLKKKYYDYKIQENLVYNYIQTTNKESKGISLTDVLEETRIDEQYYKDDARTTGTDGYLRQIKALKYKNRANDELFVGTFLSREQDKPVQLIWEEEYNEDDLQLLDGIKEIDLSGITDFYKDSWNGLDDFKAKGQMSLKQWKDSILITTHTGTQTLKNVEAKPKMEYTEKGVTKEKTMTIRPLEELKFAYTLTVKDNTITLEADLTDTLANYYKLFKNYSIKECTYKIVIEEVDSSDDSIKEHFNDIEVTQTKQYKDNVDVNVYATMEDIKNPEKDAIYLVGQDEIPEKAYNYDGKKFVELENLDEIYKPIEVTETVEESNETQESEKGEE